MSVSYNKDSYFTNAHFSRVLQPFFECNRAIIHGLETARLKGLCFQMFSGYLLSFSILDALYKKTIYFTASLCVTVRST